MITVPWSSGLSIQVAITSEMDSFVCLFQILLKKF